MVQKAQNITQSAIIIDFLSKRQWYNATMKTATVIVIICIVGIVACVTSIVLIATNVLGKRNAFDYDENVLTIPLKKQK